MGSNWDQDKHKCADGQNGQNNLSRLTLCCANTAITDGGFALRENGSIVYIPYAPMGASQVRHGNKNPKTCTVPLPLSAISVPAMGQRHSV